MPIDDMKESGYDNESRHFKEQDAEALAKLRAKLDAQRKERQETTDRPDNWMKCPKCGGDMEEIEKDSVLVDLCKQCKGIYFDAGELEMLIESRKSDGFLAGLKNLF